MTSLGRGRGWAQSKNSPLPRPGRPLSPRDIDCTNLINRINRIDNDGTSARRISEVRTLVNEAVESGSLKAVIEKLYKHALNDKDFGRKFILLFRDQSFQQISDKEGKNARYFLICALQNDYTRRDELRQESIVQFRNAILLFWEVYSHIKMACGSPLEILELPLLDYLEMLLETHSADDIKIFIDQISVIGKNLYNKYEAQLDKLMITSRQILIKEQLSPGSRQMLLYAIDLANQKFDSLPSNLQKLYEPQSKNLTQHLNNDLANDATNKPENDALSTPDCGRCNVDAKENLNSEIDAIGKAMRAPILEGTAKSEAFDKHVSQRYYAPSTNNRTLRAIRGSGATDAVKEPRVHGKVNMTSTPKPSSNNKGWGHDDRFEKDYE